MELKKRYQVVGIGKETKRKRTREYTAHSEEQVREFADRDGTLVDAVFELPPYPPSEDQISYARVLGITIPDEVSSLELSDLISYRELRDRPARVELVEYAGSVGITLTKYTGKKLLFRRIFDKLIEEGRDCELASWFIYRVYRDLIEGRVDSAIKSANDEKIKIIAINLVKNESVMKSIKRYQGENLIWFGQFTAQGKNVNGGSRNSTAYKEVANLLSRLVNNENREYNQKRQREWDSRPMPPILEVGRSNKRLSKDNVIMAAVILICIIMWIYSL